MKYLAKVAGVAAGLGRSTSTSHIFFHFLNKPLVDETIIQMHSTFSLGAAAMSFGVLCGLSIFPQCIAAGIWQIAAGFLIIVIEVIYQ